jgi:predicted transcriptional regulator
MPAKLPPKTKLARALEEANISLEDLAGVSGIPQSYLYHLSMGYKRANPPLDRIRVLMDSLQCKFEEIF